MIHYSHTQRSRLLGPLAIGVVTLIVFVAAVSREALAIGIVLISGALVALLALVFSRLTVEVAADHIRVAFGACWPRRRIELSDVVSARAVRNRWWYGWGIRLTPVGLVWNVWGLDAVEFQLANGRRFRVGTDEPQELLAVLAGKAAL